VNRIGSSVLTGRNVPTPPSAVVLTASVLCSPPCSGRRRPAGKGDKNPAKLQSAIIVNALNLSTGCSSYIRRRVSSS